MVSQQVNIRGGHDGLQQAGEHDKRQLVRQVDSWNGLEGAEQVKILGEMAGQVTPDRPC